MLQEKLRILLDQVLSEVFEQIRIEHISSSFFNIEIINDIFGTSLLKVFDRLKSRLNHFFNKEVITVVFQLLILITVVEDALNHLFQMLVYSFLTNLLLLHYRLVEL